MIVLIVDNVALNRKLLRSILATEGHRILDAEDGLAALEILEREQIDAVISDILMPQMDGYRLCYEMRQNSRLKTVPFIAHTATYTSHEDEQVALNCGADKFLRKPASPEDILNALREVTQNSNGRRVTHLGKPQELTAMRDYSQALVRKLEENNQELAKLNEALQERALLAEFSAYIANALMHRGSLRQILQLCAEGMIRHLGAKSARIWTMDQKENVLELQASAGLDTHIGSGHARVSMGQHEIGLIASERKPHVTNSVIGDARVHDQEWAKREGLIAFAGYPLLIEDRLVGVMAIFARKTLTANVLKVMESASKSIAVGVERKWTEEERQKVTDRIQALHEIAKTINSTLSLKTILQVLLEKIDFYLPFPVTTAIRLFNQATGEFEKTACRNLDEPSWKIRTGEKTGQLTREIQQIKEPVIIHNIQEEGQRKLGFFRRQGFISYLGVPLIAKDGVIGILGCFTKTPHEFTQQEIDFLLGLAGQAAIAIHNAELFEEIGHSNAELEKTTRYLGRSLKRLGGLYTALTPIAPSSSTEEMMDGILDRIMDATGADAALIRTWDKNANSYPIIGQRGFPENYVKQVVTASAGGAVDWVISYGGPIIAPDIATESRLKGKIQMQLGLRSCALLPLIIDDEVRGVMHVASRKLGYFDDAQKEHLSAIARQMSVALENRELFYGLKKSRDELERANKVKDEFLNVMSHELRTPVNLIMGFTNLLKEDAIGQEDGLKKISSASRDLLTVVDSILYATLLETDQLTMESQELSLPSLLAELQGNYETSKPNHISLIWEYAADLPRIKTDPKKLKQILNNLIHNALKFTEQGETTVSAKLLQTMGNGPGNNAARLANGSQFITVSKPDGWIEFEVTDPGGGTPADNLPKIFDKFYQADSSQSRRYEGMGLGLYIVKKFTHLLGGKIDVASEVGKGSRFIVTIPASYQPPANPAGFAGAAPTSD